MPSKRREDEKIDLQRGMRQFDLRPGGIDEHEVERHQRIVAAKRGIPLSARNARHNKDAAESHSGAATARPRLQGSSTPPRSPQSPRSPQDEQFAAEEWERVMAPSWSDRAPFLKKPVSQTPHGPCVSPRADLRGCVCSARKRGKPPS